MWNEHRREEVEELVSQYIDRMNRGERLTPGQVWSEHPELGEEILDHLETFVDLSSEPEAPPLRTLGDYTLRRSLGRGGMGVVYEAWQESLERQVALKVLPAGIAADDRSFHRFMREAKTTASLSHANIVGVHGVGIEQDTPYYAMEYVEGETLAQVLGRVRGAAPDVDTPFGKLDDARFYIGIAEAFADVADGLQHAHSRGVVHRDIKPSNLILDAEADQGGRSKCRVRILDFGLARLEGQEGLTLTGDIVGTPAYMSPEQARRKQIPIDHRTDIYSLGATLYELITQQQPFRGKDHADTLSQILEREARPPRQLNPRVPADLETVVLKCLRKDSGDRYGTAEALGQDLRRFVRGDPIEARPTSRWEVLRRVLWAGRRRVAVGAVLLLSLVTSGLFLVGYRDIQHQKMEREYRRAVLQAIEALQIAQRSAYVGRGDVSRRLELAEALSAGAWTAARDAPSRTEMALSNLKAAVHSFPDRPDARFHLAKSLWRLGRDEDASKQLTRLLERTPDFVPAIVLQASIRGETDPGGWTRREEMPPQSRTVSRWTEMWIEAHAAIRQGDWAVAEVAYTTMRTLEKESGGVYLGASLETLLGRGVVRLEARDYDGALIDLAKAHALFPALLAPGLSLGEALLLAGRPESAARWFAEFHGQVRFQDRDRTAFEIASVYYSRVDCEEALRWIEKMSPGLRRERSRLYFLPLVKRYEDAKRAGAEALRYAPDDPLTLAFLGLLWTHFLGEYEKAATYMDRAVDHAGENARVWLFAGYGYGQADLFGKQEAAYRRALELQPDFHIAREQLALNLYYQQRYEEAVVEFRRCLGGTRRDARILARIGRCFMRLGDLAQSESQLKEALRVDPREMWALSYHGLVQEQLGRQHDAEEAYKEAIALWSEVPESHWQLAGMFLARLYARQERFNESLSWYCRAIPDMRSSVDLAAFLHEFNALLRWKPKPDELSCLDDVVTHLDQSLQGGRNLPRIHEGFALALLYAPERGNAKKALGHALTAVEAIESPALLATLATAQVANGDLRGAIDTMEAAVALPDSKDEHRAQLEEYRAVANDLPAEAR